MSRHKWFKFDAETWLSDPKLRSVSYGAQGLWINIICLCHLSEKYGYLTHNGTKMTRKQLQSCTNSTRNWHQLFDELLLNCILRQDDEGFYYCHKLLKDKAFQESQSVHGKKGGNPTLKATLNPHLKATLKPEKEEEEDKEIEEDIKKTKPKKEISSDQLRYKQALEHDHLKNSEFKELWEEFCRSRGSQYTVIAKYRALKKLFRYEVTTCISAIENSLSNGYKGLFPENANPNKNNSNSPSEKLTWKQKQKKMFADEIKRLADEKAVNEARQTNIKLLEG